MSSSPPESSPKRRLIDHLTIITAHANALRRRLRRGAALDPAVAVGHLDAIDREVDAVAVLVHELPVAENPPAS